MSSHRMSGRQVVIKRKKRAVLKITGAMLRKDTGNFDVDQVNYIVTEILSVCDSVQLAVVFGGGNFFRGRDLKVDRTGERETLGLSDNCADYLGMTATIMNAMVIEDALDRAQQPVVAMSAIEAPALMELYQPRKAKKALEDENVVILAGGTGHTGVTTDSAAMSLAHAIQADLVLKGTNVDYVYDKDPKIHKDAEPLRKLTHQKFLQLRLSKILDETAVAGAMMHDGGMEIRVYNAFVPGRLQKVLLGNDDDCCTIIHPE